MYIDKDTLKESTTKLYGTAGHLLKIWFTLKHMGLNIDSPAVEVDTANSTPSLKRLFSFGDPDNKFYIPFAHTPRYLTMKHDASRSIIQTTIQRWATSGSVVTCDPTEYLSVTTKDTKLYASTSRKYPFGLGFGGAGFAREDGQRVTIPITAFAIWYGRTTDIPKGVDPKSFIIDAMLTELHISPSERGLVFVEDNTEIKTQATPLTDKDIYSVCQARIESEEEPSLELHSEDFPTYARRVNSMVSGLNQPTWMRVSPEVEVKDLLKAGAKSILLFGPPRTGKTRLIDQVIPRTSKDRCTIQIHDGWGYDNLIEGFRPDSSGKWAWDSGPLKKAIESGKKYIVLEEINRTAITQAIGEVFSLIEDTYRGKHNSITLRSGQVFWIPEDVVFFMTMNTVDKSTEEVDDALISRVAAVEFPPKSESLLAMLTANGVPAPISDKISKLFSEILNIYPLGHGYFSGLSEKTTERDVITYYKARVRPVLANFMGELKRQELATIDNVVDNLFFAK